MSFPVRWSALVFGFTGIPYANESSGGHSRRGTDHGDHCRVRARTAAQNLTIVRETAPKSFKASPGQGSLRRKRKRSAPDSRFREGPTNLIFQTFGA